MSNTKAQPDAAFWNLINLRTAGARAKIDGKDRNTNPHDAKKHPWHHAQWGIGYDNGHAGITKTR